MSFVSRNFPVPDDDLRTDVLTGLDASPKRIPPKYFYDETGCQLFETICAQPEYTLCRAERALMSARIDAITAAVGDVECIIEPGAGDCVKVRRLLDALQPAHFVGIDIAAAPLAAAAAALSGDYPLLEITALGMDFVQDLEAATPHLPPGRRLVYYPGSSIGNFPPAEAIALLERFRRLAGPESQLLIGFDLRKDPLLLHAAYNDAAGATAAFNLNLLVRLNRELAANFDPSGFRHYAFYNAAAGRIEMHLVSLAEQVVDVADRRFHFDRGETLLTEYSYKFIPREFSTLAAAAGWQPRASWEHDGFAVQLYG